MIIDKRIRRVLDGGPVATSMLCREAASQLAAAIPADGWVPNPGKAPNSFKRGADGAFRAFGVALGKAWDLELDQAFLTRAEPGYYSPPHHDQPGHLDRVALFYLTGNGGVVDFVGLGLKVQTMPGLLLVIDPAEPHQVPLTSETRHFLRLDYSIP